MNPIRVLYIRYNAEALKLHLPEELELTEVEALAEKPREDFDLVLLDRNIREEERELLCRSIKAYTLFVTDRVCLNRETEWLIQSRCGQILKTEDAEAFLRENGRNFFSRPYGGKNNPEQLCPARSFGGKIHWIGQYGLRLEGSFGAELCQAAYWRGNLPLYAGQALDIWLEYEKTPGIEIALEITIFESGQIAKILRREVYSEQELRTLITLEGCEKNGHYFMSVLAKGEGTLTVIALHTRVSRRGFGDFLPGGRTYITSKREEVFSYLEPMDMKPPLNVYFSGYKTLEGFEGYYMMRGMGAPFLLIGEARLTGGAFYTGDEEYEKQIIEIIEACRKRLGFSRDQVILSGLSMGTYGALYYGSRLTPHALVLGKPLASLGQMADNERLHRPGGFPTAMDLALHFGGGTDEAGVRRLNEHFWNCFDRADFSGTRFIISYMMEDDYDRTAYGDILEHLKNSGVTVYGKGLHGRHNDNTGGIVQWFVRQYRRLLEEDFDRKG